MAQITGNSTAGDDALVRYLKSLEARIAQLEHEAPRSLAFSDGTRIRTQVGLMADGKYGIRIWNAAGVLQVDNTF